MYHLFSQSPPLLPRSISYLHLGRPRRLATMHVADPLELLQRLAPELRSQDAVHPRQERQPSVFSPIRQTPSQKERKKRQRHSPHPRLPRPPPSPTDRKTSHLLRLDHRIHDPILQRLPPRPPMRLEEHLPRHLRIQLQPRQRADPVEV